MTRDEALECEQRINDSADALARHLEEMQAREGWRALGFDSWTAYLDSGRLDRSRATLYRYRRMARVDMSQFETGLNHAQRYALSAYDSDDQPTIYKAASRLAEQEGKDAPTAGHIRVAGDTITQAANTGYVDAGDDDNPVSIAMRRSDSERKARQREHMDAGRTIQEKAAQLIKLFVAQHGDEGVQALAYALQDYTRKAA